MYQYFFCMLYNFCVFKLVISVFLISGNCSKVTFTKELHSVYVLLDTLGHAQFAWILTGSAGTCLVLRVHPRTHPKFPWKGKIGRAGQAFRGVANFFCWKLVYTFLIIILLSHFGIPNKFLRNFRDSLNTIGKKMTLNHPSLLVCLITWSVHSVTFQNSVGSSPVMMLYFKVLKFQDIKYLSSSYVHMFHPPRYLVHSCMDIFTRL